MDEHMARALGWDEEIGQLEKRVSERFGDWAIAEAHGRALQALEALRETREGTFRHAWSAALKSRTPEAPDGGLKGR